MRGRIRVRRRSWVVCRTEPRRERWAAENVHRQGHRWYLPYYKRSYLGRESKALLFPSYLFVQPKHKQWTSLLSTYGIVDVILLGREPAWLEDKVVEDLKLQENEEGVITLPQPETKKFEKGEKVKLRSGIFLGYIGIYEGTTRADRERVLLNLLGRETPVEVDTWQIENDL